MGVKELLDCQDKLNLGDAIMLDLTNTLDKLDAVAKDTMNIVAKVAENVSSSTPKKMSAPAAKKNNKTTLLSTTTSSSKRRQQKKPEDDKLEVPSTYWSVMSYLSYVFLVVIGYMREMIYGIGPIGECGLLVRSFMDLG
jgi:hypothetical protein